MSPAHVVQLLEWREKPRVREAPRVVGTAVIDGDEVRCHAGEEPCAPGCIDDEIARDLARQDGDDAGEDES